MKLKLISLLLILISLITYGQNEANIWYFGNDGAGLNFNNGCIPTVLTNGKINGFEGCASISDNANGQFLFSTNSEWVWNRNQDTIPNSHLIKSANTITQVMIIQKPEFDSLYYIITSEIQAGLTGLGSAGYQFHLIDMKMNGGLGGVAFKDSVLYSSPVTEKITAIRHSNGTDIWLIGHQYDSNKFLLFLVTSAGINRTPVISQIGKVNGGTSSVDAIGELKASPDGSKLATVTLGQPNIELFNFDNSTGQVSNLITLNEKGAYDTIGNSSGLYGLSFSPNNSMLYVSEWYNSFLGVQGKIIQYNITSNDSATINSSRVDVFTSSNISIYSLKLAPNGKIYAGHNIDKNYIGVINFPDSDGLSCNYVDSAVFLNGKHSGWGLNNLMEYGNYCNNTDIPTISSLSDSLKIYPNPSQNQFTIEYKLPQGESKGEIIIYDIAGTEVKKVTVTNGSSKAELDNSALQSGIYFYQLITSKGATGGKKMVVIK
jgi:hypothetical protein